jgi:hypothetical protein
MNLKAKSQPEQSRQEEQILPALNAHWHASAIGAANAGHDICHDDAVCDYPQSGERILGRSNLQAWRSHHPGKPSGFKVSRILGKRESLDHGLRNHIPARSAWRTTNPCSLPTLLAVLTCRRIEAGVGQHQSLYRPAAEDVRFDDLIYICLGDVSIPDGFGIDHNIGTVLTLIQTARLVGAHSAFEAALRQFLFESFLQLRLATWIAASSWTSRWPLIATYENVFFKFGHKSHLNPNDLDSTLHYLFALLSASQPR